MQNDIFLKLLYNMKIKGMIHEKYMQVEIIQENSDHWGIKNRAVIGHKKSIMVIRLFKVSFIEILDIETLVSEILMSNISNIHRNVNV